MNDVDMAHAGFWLGHPGSLLPMHGFVSPYSVDDEEAATFKVSMSGRVRARVRRHRAARSWDIELPTVYPRDVSHLKALLASTLPPYVMVTPDAQVSNVLTPERSVMSSLSQPSGGLALGGSWPLEGGGVSTVTRLNPSAAFGNEAHVFLGPCPIPPNWTNRKVTASVWLATAHSEGAYVQMQWLDAAGTQITPPSNGNTVTGMDALRRSTVTATPPLGAVSCRLLISYAEVIAQPQVTWTDAPTEWDVGAGADRVVVHGLSRTIQSARPGHVLHDVSFTATEVGP